MKIITLEHCYTCRKILKRLHIGHLEIVKLKNSIEGLGDIISIITYYLYIPHCNKCEQRRTLLNQWFPLKNIIKEKYRYPSDNQEVRKVIKHFNIHHFPLMVTDDLKYIKLLK